MNEKKGLGFAVNTAVKLLTYLLLCIGAYIFSGFTGETGAFLSPLAAAVITWMFLRFMEGGRRSVFAKGYSLENIIPGGIIGIMTAAVPIAAEYILGRLHVNGFTSGVDLRLPFYGVFKNSLFAGIVFFGYVFHILQKDAGNVCAVTVSSVLYTAFGIISAGGRGVVLGVDIHSPEGIVYMLTLILTGAAAGLCIINFGDMRSGTAFVCLKNFTEAMIVLLMSITYKGIAAGEADFMYVELVSPVALGILCLWLFVSAVKKR